MAEKFDGLETRFEDFFRDWHIVREIGRGTYGSVYEIQREAGGVTDRAALKHVSFPKDQYDLQAICSEIGTSDEAAVRDYIYQSVQEYRGEYQIMRELKGMTNIVSCEDFQIIEKTDMPGYDIFIRMELLDTVSSLMTKEQFSRDEVIRLGIDICSALKLLEKKNILHRDIKPENIFRNQNGDYKLGDFGSARTMSGTRSIVTAKGTPAYMAPEILLLKEAGPYTDIYSLGLVMFRLMNDNRSPFLEAGLSSTTMSREAAASRRVSGEKLPKPVNADEGLAQVILKACEFKPEDRYQTAEEMSRDLQALLNSESNGEKAGKAASAGGKKKKSETPEEPKEKLSFEGTHLGRKNVLSAADLEAIKKAEEEKIRKEKEREEAARLEAERQKKEKKKKTLITLISAVAAIAVIAVAVMLISQSARKKADYDAAVAMLDSSDLEGAQKALEAFEDSYEDTAEKKNQVKDALEARDKSFKEASGTIGKEAEELTAEELDAAIAALRGILKQYPAGERQDEVNSLINQAREKKKILEALALAETDPDQAAEDLDSLGETERAQAIRNEQKYQKALNCIEGEKNRNSEESLQQGIALFQELANDGYRVAECLAKMTQGQARIEYIHAQTKLATAKTGEEFKSAAEDFDRIVSGKQDYWDAASRAKEAWARYYLAGEDYRAAVKALEDADDSDSVLRDLAEQAASGARMAERFDAAEKDISDAADYYAIGTASNVDENTVKESFQSAQNLYREAQGIFEDLGKEEFTYHGAAAADRAAYCGNWVTYLEGRIAYLAERYPYARTQFNKLDADFEDAAAQGVRAQIAFLLNQAESAYGQGDTEKAKNLFQQVKDLAGGEEAGQAGLDKVQKAEEDQASFALAQQKIAERDYPGALEELAKLGEGYPGAQALREEAEDNLSTKQKFETAAGLESEGKFEEALDLFNQIDAYEGLEEHRTWCEQNIAYAEARRKIAEGSLSSAKRDLEALKNAGFTAAETELAQIARYTEASGLMDAGKYPAAKEAFDSLAAESFWDAADQAAECEKKIQRFASAAALEEAGDYEGALALYEGISEYEGAADRIRACQQQLDYAEACEKIGTGDFRSAESTLTQLSRAQFPGADEKLAQIAEYRDAAGKLNSGDYDGALEIFTRLGESGFYDAAEQAAECSRRIQIYRSALEKESIPDYSGALALFEQVSQYADAADHIRSCQQHIDYNAALKAIDAGELDSAEQTLTQLSNAQFPGADEKRAQIALYREASNNQNNGNYQDALNQFNSLPGFYDAALRAAECDREVRYASAVSLMESDPDTARTIFESLGTLHDSEKNKEKCDDAINYRTAVERMNAGDYSGALNYLDQLNDRNYANSVALRSECDKNLRYNEAVRLMEQGRYEEAYNILGSEEMKGVRDDVETRARECQYEMFCAEVSGSGNPILRREYRYIFDQNMDRNAKLVWARGLTKDTETPTGAELAVNFAYADQFKAQGLTWEPSLRVFYSVLLNIQDYKADPQFSEYYRCLENGVSMRFILSRMIQRQEYTDLCRDNGIIVGEVELTESRDFDYNVTRFVCHCYRTIFPGHDPEDVDLNNYCSMILEERITMEDLMLALMGSAECQSRNLDDAGYVQMIYLAFFGREASEEDISNQVGNIRANGWTWENLARELVTSVECQKYLTDNYRPEMKQFVLEETREEFIAAASGGTPVNSFANNAYSFIYSHPRTPAAEKRAWAAALQIHGSVRDLVESFTAYPAYSAAAVSNADRVSAMYRIMLCRDADSSSATFLAALDAGMSYWYVANSISASQEFAEKCAQEGVDPGTFNSAGEPRDVNYNLTALVNRCYLEGLGRPATSDDLNDWCGRVLNGSMSLTELMTGLLNSKEARENYLADNTAFVNALYSILLEREADEGGLMDKVSMLEQGAERGAVMDSIFESEEFTNKWRNEKQLLP